MRVITDMNVGGLDLNLLLVLDAVLAERSVTRAAARLGLSQPAVSNALARLRARLSDPLVVRTAHGVVPTDYALRISGPVRQALFLLHDAIASNELFDASTVSRSFTIAMSDFTAFVLLPSLLDVLGREAPGAGLNVVPWPGRRARTLLERGEIDFAVGHLSAPPVGVHSLVLFEDRFVCVASAKHPRIRTRLTLRAYSKLSHVVVASEASTAPTRVDRFLEERQLRRKIGLRVSSFLMVPPIVAATDMIAALGLRVAEPLSKTHGLRLLEPPFPEERRTFFLLWHERTQSARAHGWVRERVAMAARELKPLGNRR